MTSRAASSAWNLEALCFVGIDDSVKTLGSLATGSLATGSVNGGSMRILWTLLKVIIGLAIAIPLGIVALVLTLGVLGGLLGLAIVALKLAFVGFIGYGLLRVARYVFAPAPKPSTQPIRELPMPDPYYEAAMRELDAEMGHTSRR